jgi:hypothetical protein
VANGPAVVSAVAADVAGNSASDATNVDVENVVASDCVGACDGYLDASGSTRIGQDGIVHGVADADFADPVGKIEVRVDLYMGQLKRGGSIVAMKGGSAARQWTLTLSGTTELNWGLSETGSSWADVVTTSGASVGSHQRMQYRVVHDGTQVWIYERDPAVVDAHLGEDTGWVLVAQDLAFGADVANMADEVAPVSFFQALRGGTVGIPYRVHEFRLWYDDVVVSSFVGGNVAVDAGTDSFVDDTGLTWSWGNDPDPTPVFIVE